MSLTSLKNLTRLKNLPNILTSVRLFLIVPFLICLYQKNYANSFYIFVLAGFTDGLDGWLARHFHWQSTFGLVVDPIADKLFIGLSVISLAIMGQLPWWLFGLIFFRDLSILTGVLAWYRVEHLRVEFKPSRLSQINAVLQGSLVTLCLFELAFSPVYPSVKLLLIAVTTLTTTASYIDYGWTWSKKVLTRRSLPQ